MSVYYFDSSALGRLNRSNCLAHFLGLLIGVQNPPTIGVLGQDGRVQKPGKEFGSKTAFLDTPIFICADTNLNEVAQAENLSVQNPNDHA